jgi:hypothetical protein
LNISFGGSIHSTHLLLNKYVCGIKPYQTCQTKNDVQTPDSELPIDFQQERHAWFTISEDEKRRELALPVANHAVILRDTTRLEKTSICGDCFLLNSEQLTANASDLKAHSICNNVPIQNEAKCQPEIIDDAKLYKGVAHWQETLINSYVYPAAKEMNILDKLELVQDVPFGDRPGHKCAEVVEIDQSSTSLGY